MKVILTEEQVLRAIVRLMKYRQQGLCSCFDFLRIEERHSVFWLPELLNRLGGRQRDGYYWPIFSDEGFNQRAMFLAFMLEWSKQK
jgi:hypothetical protein